MPSSASSSPWLQNTATSLTNGKYVNVCVKPISWLPSSKRKSKRQRVRATPSSRKCWVRCRRWNATFSVIQNTPSAVRLSWNGLNCCCRSCRRSFWYDPSQSATPQLHELWRGHPASGFFLLHDCLPHGRQWSRQIDTTRCDYLGTLGRDTRQKPGRRGPPWTGRSRGGIYL